MKTFSHLYGDAYHPINKKRSSFESWNWVLHFGGGVNLTSRNKGLPVVCGFLLLFEPNRDFHPSCGKNWSVGGHIIIDQLFWDVVHIILILLFLMWYTAVLSSQAFFPNSDWYEWGGLWRSRRGVSTFDTTNHPPSWEEKCLTPKHLRFHQDFILYNSLEMSKSW